MACTKMVRIALCLEILAVASTALMQRDIGSRGLRLQMLKVDIVKSSARRDGYHDRLLGIRGGSDDDDDDDLDDDDLDDDVFEDDEDDVSESDFAGETMQARVVKAWDTTPPITQVYVGASLALTVGCFLLNSNMWPEWMHFQAKATFVGLQLWRPLTAFLFFGPFGVSYLLTMHFVWTYLGTLEKLSHAEPWDFAIMLCFGAALLTTGVVTFSMNSRYLAHNLSCYLVYIWARSYEGQEVNVLEFFSIKAELLPWFFAAQTYLLEQELPVHDLLGIALGHLYCWSRQRSFIKAPKWFINLFRNRPELMAKYEKIGEEFA